jgi:hypothetical protein
MAFGKSFPRTLPGSTYPKWEEVELTEEEEKEREEKARQENIMMMKQCIDDAKAIFSEKDLKDYQTDVVNAAVALFEKMASHSVYLKESKAKEKFNEIYGNKK